jgi:hypothetical protein
MNNLITKIDFESTFQVFAGTEEMESKLDDVIERYQPQILRKILGEIEYQSFANDITNGVPASAKWVSFLDGKTYTANGVTYYYEGIKPVLVRFMFYYWHLEMLTIPGEMGQLKPEYQKIKQVVNGAKLAGAYNEACEMIVNTTDAYYPSVWNFLNDAGYTFTDWNYHRIAKISPYL